MVRTRPLAAGAAALALLAGCGDGVSSSRSVTSDAAEAAVSAVGKGRVDVEGGVIQVAASRDGIITEVRAEEGQAVKAGDVLAVQDNRQAKAELAQARANLAEARARTPLAEVRLAAARRERARLETLVAAKGAAQRELDAASDDAALAVHELEATRAAAAVAAARVEAAVVELDLRTIRAPVDGIIARRLARPGVGASTLNTTTLFTIVPATPRIVRIELEERFVPLVGQGQSVVVIPEAAPDARIMGQVVRIGQVLGQKRPSAFDDPNEKVDERVVEVVASLEDQALLIGQRVLVRFEPTRSVAR